MPDIHRQACGGRHAESAAIRTLLAYAGVQNPFTGDVPSEALCFGIAGGIGAGYSSCPSMARAGIASGISIVGRHKVYATGADWYQGCFERLGVATRIAETAAPGKALANLQAELAAGRPTVVWCSRTHLPYLHDLMPSCGYWMHSFVATEIDAQQGVARGCDRLPKPVTIDLDDLAAARGAICSHKNRTLSLDSASKLTKARLKEAVLAGIAACLDDLYRRPRMKAFSLSGFETLAKAIDNDKAKDGWLKAFSPGMLYQALRDAFISIETGGTGGGLFRGMFADFLAEAAEMTGRHSLGDLASQYRELAQQWTDTGYFLLPRDSRPLNQTRTLLIKQRDLLETKGAAADKQLAAITAELRALGKDMDESFPLDRDSARELLHGVRCRLVGLHASERNLAERLAAAVA